jgi:uncharacterized damage-inducible protein DinB
MRRLSAFPITTAGVTVARSGARCTVRSAIRFDGWPKPAVIQKESATLIDNFDDLKRQRIDADQRISDWAGRVTNEWLAEDQTWFSPSINKELRKPRSFLVTHFFNHQTHHRGQAHAIITACGEKTGDTDLFLVVPELV